MSKECLASVSWNLCACVRACSLFVVASCCAFCHGGSGRRARSGEWKATAKGERGRAQGNGRGAKGEWRWAQSHKRTAECERRRMKAKGGNDEMHRRAEGEGRMGPRRKECVACTRIVRSSLQRDPAGGSAGGVTGGFGRGDRRRVSQEGSQEGSCRRGRTGGRTGGSHGGSHSKA